MPDFHTGDRVIDRTDPRHVARVVRMNQMGGWHLDVVFEATGWEGRIDLNNAERAGKDQ